jgi:hypothetical protein
LPGEYHEGEGKIFFLQAINSCYVEHLSFKGKVGFSFDNVPIHQKKQ